MQQDVLGKPLPRPITSLLNPALGMVLNPNPYEVEAAGVSLRLMRVGQYPGITSLPSRGPTPEYAWLSTPGSAPVPPWNPHSSTWIPSSTTCSGGMP